MECTRADVTKVLWRGGGGACGREGGFSQMRQSREVRVACDGNYRVVNIKKTENTGFLCELLITYSLEKQTYRKISQIVLHRAVE